MDCLKKDTCQNYPSMCKECWMISDFRNNTPHYHKKKLGTSNCKLFFGDRTFLADSTMNAWLSEHPTVRITHMSHSQSEHQLHSICIIYEDDGDG